MPIENLLDRPALFLPSVTGRASTSFKVECTPIPAGMGSVGGRSGKGELLAALERREISIRYIPGSLDEVGAT